MNEVVSTEMALPIPIGIQLIDKHGSTFAAVAIQVTLAVTVQVETARHPRSFDRRFPNAGVHCFVLPNDVPRQTDIDRNQSSHHSGPYEGRKDGANWINVTRTIVTNAAIVTTLSILVLPLLERGNLRAATGQPAGPALASVSCRRRRR
jgi:hypothetical protein